MPQVEHYSNLFQALGNGSRLEIVRLLLSAFHLGGLKVGQIQQELKIPGSTLNHHLEKLKQVGLLKAHKEKQWIWYSVDQDTLTDMLRFLFSECCGRTDVVPVSAVAPNHFTRGKP
ncbi:MAG TPA: metalloregulator ArsR/SmtB family transcription factor [Acidobacteriota bacterium]|jgi:DNA-binding transcriptional ArsR family regulator